MRDEDRLVCPICKKLNHFSKLWAGQFFNMTCMGCGKTTKKFWVDIFQYYVVIDEELVTTFLLSKENEHDPKKALNDIICWNNQVALCPEVSEEARDLIQQGRDEVLKELKGYLDTAGGECELVSKVMDMVEETE